MIPEEFVIQIDDELLQDGVALHARPMGVLARWMRDNGISGDILDERYYSPLRQAYDRLYPEGDFGLPPMLEGGVGFRDQVFLVRANVGFGTFAIDPKDSIEISQSALLQVWQNSPRQFWRSYYVVADIWDFAYGASDLRGNAETDALLANAHGHITAVARALRAAGNAAAVVQSACLVAELSMKGVLAQAGVPEPDRRRLGHHLPELAEAVIARMPNSDDDRLRSTVQAFPNFINSRYEHHGMSRIGLIDLMHRSQFVAADSVRRLTERNLAGQLNDDTSFPARETW